MASLTRWTWILGSSVSWWWTGRPGVLQSIGSQRVRHDWMAGLNWILCILFVGIEIGTAIVENSMEISQKTKNRTIIWTSYSTLRYILKENENTNLKRYIHPNILSSILYNSQDVEATYILAILWRRQWHPTPVLLPGKSHGQRSLVGYSPWGREELNTTDWLHFHFSLSCIGEGNGNPLQCSCLENPRDEGTWWAAVCGVTQSRTWLKWLSIA